MHFLNQSFTTHSYSIYIKNKEMVILLPFTYLYQVVVLAKIGGRIMKMKYLKLLWYAFKENFIDDVRHYLKSSNTKEIRS